jgi:prepilin-type N-terminal cleavage/methylation domain-containing protein
LGEAQIGFTLVEVLVAIAIVGLVFTSILTSYVSATDRSEWSAYSLAAQSLALEGIEQVRSAKWDPQAWPVVDDLGVTNLIQVEQLDVAASRQVVFATNFITVTAVPGPITMRQIRADCVWVLESRTPANRGPFTNTAVSLRAPDQ